MKPGYKALLLVLLVAIGFHTSAQQHNSNTGKAVVSDFVNSEVVFDKSSIISNVLKIKNNNGKPYRLHLLVSIPHGWRSLVNENKVFTINPGDSVFIPVRIVPMFSGASGGTKYTINTTVLSIDGKIMSASFFFANKPVVSNWQMRILPRPRIYFLNDENTARFQVNVANNGDEPKNVILSFNAIGKEIVLGDSLLGKLPKTYMDLLLQPYEDTLIPFSVTLGKLRKNLKRVDVDFYIPNQLAEGRKYMMYIKAGEVGNSKQRSDVNAKISFIKLANNIDFVKLSDNFKVNPYGSSTIPVIADLNFYSLFTNSQPLANLNLYGNDRISPKAIVSYQFQMNLSQFPSSNTLTQMFGSLGYYHEKGFIQVSNTGFGQGIGGLGINAGYYLTKTKRISGFISRGYTNTQFHPNFGLSFQDAVARLFRYSVGYQHAQNSPVIYSDIFSGALGFNLLRSQTFYFSDGTSYNTNYITGKKLTGNNISGSYNGNFLKGKFTSLISANHIDRTYNTAGLGIFYLTANNSVTIAKKYFLSLQNQYNDYDNYITTSGVPSIVQNKGIYNQLGFSKSTLNKTKINYFIFQNYSDYYTGRISFIGAGFNTGYYDPDRNLRMQTLTKGGFNRQYNVPGSKDFFSAQFYTLVAYHTLNINFNYNYSARSINTGAASSITSLQANYSQEMRISLSHQQQLGKMVIFENNISYDYLNALQKTNFGLFSTIYFYTFSGWRLKFEFGYNLSSSLAYKYEYTGSGAPVLTQTDGKTSSAGFQVNMGIRKQLGIPVPKRMAREKYTNTRFVAFLDMNGNKILDNNEVPLENIVVKLNDNEVLTNKNGEVIFSNVLCGKYHLQAFSLVDLGAWFPVIPDSIDISSLETHYIPFSKGVKIDGGVEVQREKYSGEVFDNLDLSKIKITLTDSAGHNTVTSITDAKGNFTFYVPYGNYTLSMDEGVLSSNFSVAQNNVNVNLMDGMDNFYYTFFIIENKRKVVKKKFNQNGELISENTDIADIYTGNNKDANNKNDLANNETYDTIAIFKRDEQKAANKTIEIDRLNEIEDKINRIDSLGNILLKNSASGFYITATGGPGGPVRKLQPAMPNKDRREVLFTIEVAYFPTGDNILKRFYSGINKSNSKKSAKEINILMDGLKNGQLQWYFHPDGGTSIIYGNFSHKQDAFINKSSLLKSGYSNEMQVKAIHQNKLITLDEAAKIK